MGKFKKGQVANPNGRPVGSKNRLPRDLVDRVLEISAELDREGKGLHDCARNNPMWFFENFLKPILPKNNSQDTAAHLIIIEAARVERHEPA